MHIDSAGGESPPIENTESPTKYDSGTLSDDPDLPELECEILKASKYPKNAWDFGLSLPLSSKNKPFPGKDGLLIKTALENMHKTKDALCQLVPNTFKISQSNYGGKSEELLFFDFTIQVTEGMDIREWEDDLESCVEAPLNKIRKYHIQKVTCAKASDYISAAVRPSTENGPTQGATSPPTSFSFAGFSDALPPVNGPGKHALPADTESHSDAEDLSTKKKKQKKQGKHALPADSDSDSD